MNLANQDDYLIVALLPTYGPILHKCRPYAPKAALLSYIEKLQREDLLELERKHAQQIEIQKEIELNERERQIQKDRKAVEAQILNEQV